MHNMHKSLTHHPLRAGAAGRVLTARRFSTLCSRLRGFRPNTEHTIRVCLHPTVNRRAIRSALRQVLTNTPALLPTDINLICKATRIIISTGGNILDALSNVHALSKTHIYGTARP